MKQQEELFFINKCLVQWVTDIKCQNAISFYDINKISENLVLELLNLIYDYELVNLNYEKSNYPGIDLGDRRNAKVAFQVTSQTDPSKIRDTLSKFLKYNFIKEYNNGLRFFILDNKKNIIFSNNTFKDYKSFFHPSDHILTIDNLLLEIEKIYNCDYNKFVKIKEKLNYEFSNTIQNNERNVLVTLYHLLREYYDEIDINLDKGIDRDILNNRYDKILEYINENNIADKLILMDASLKVKYYDQTLIITTPTGVKKRRQYFIIEDGLSIQHFCLLFLNSFTAFLTEYENNSTLTNIIDFKRKLEFFKEFSGAKLFTI